MVSKEICFCRAGNLLFHTGWMKQIPRAAPALIMHRQRCGGPRDGSISKVCIEQIIEIVCLH
jgi:hypothetical protein